MTGYILRRLAQMVPVLFLITLFVFFLVRLVPGDPAAIMLGDRATPQAVAKLRAQLKLNQPYWVQYAVFLKNAVRGDLGESARQRAPVTQIVLHALPPTLFLVIYSAILSIAITVPLATWAALNRGRWPDQVVQFFAVRYRIFPVSGYGGGLFGDIRSLFLPALSLALAIASIMVRSLRNS